MPSPVAVPIELAESEREQLESWSRRPTSAQALALRSRIVLAAAGGASNAEIGRRLAIKADTARKWRNRFARDRLAGLLDEPRPGQPRKITDAQVDDVITRTLETMPKDATHWSTRSMAAEVGLNQSAVHRIWKAFGLAPHRQDTWKLSRDPQFIDKVRDVVGLYLDPPERAVVLCVDEKVRHEALSDSSGVRDPAAGLPQRPGGSGGQPDPGAAGEGGSSLDNAVTRRDCRTSWVRQARRSGETQVNQWLNPLKRRSWL